ncbi:MAG: sodium/solute symporter [Opitutaceae bacterium]|nr:sodium/solute symporter [Opitutaceae bacterium]
MTSLLGGLNWIDAAIIVAYLALLAGIGSYFSRKETSLDDFIRGGSKFGWLTLGMSLMAALNSGMDYIQTPALVYAIGMVFIMAWVSWIPLYPWIARVTVPFYQKLDVYSAYEYLELRFGMGVRTVGAGIFLLWRVGWMGAAIYAPCLAVNAATGGRMDVPLMVALLGLVVTFYTMLGGMKAVVWTDVAQFCIMFGGLAATLWVVIGRIPGGVGELFQVAHESGRLNLLGSVPEATGILGQLRAFFTTEITMLGMIAVVTLSRATAFTADQIAIQRFQSARSLPEARRSYVVNAVTDTVWMVFLGFVGLALYAYAQHHPFPAGMQNDRVLPQFMLQHFPVGVTGLVIAAIFAASLSSVDSALNSGASIVVVDFYNRFWLGRSRPVPNLPVAEQRRQVLVSRLATLALGLLMIVVGMNMQRMGEIYAATNKILGAFFGPLFGIFFLGMFSRRAHSLGVLAGALAGLGSSCFASFFSTLPWLQAGCGRLFGPAFVDFFRELSWLWPSPIGVVVTLGVGWLASLVLPSARNEPPLTFREVMRRPAPGR